MIVGDYCIMIIVGCGFRGKTVDSGMKGADC